MGKVPGRKFLPMVVLFLVAFYVIKQPDAAAQTLNQIVDALTSGAQSVASFVNHVDKS
ncbi:MAG TPA: hypothetical protein VGL93_10990 [Streptosporangiaceae bacterium]|jgi:preprotein translocase subunit YajC